MKLKNGIITSLAMISIFGFIANASAAETNQNQQISESLIKELYSSLITSDHVYGLYFNEKVTSENSDNVDLIKYGINSYLLDNNIKYTDYINRCDFDEGEETPYKVSKSAVSTYLNNKFNTTIGYNLPVNINESLNSYGNFGNSVYDLYSDENDWVIKCVPRSGGEQYIDQKYVNYDRSNDDINIYTKMVYCIADVSPSYSCHSSITDYIDNDKIVDCGYVEEEEYTLFTCPGDDALEGLSEYSLENLSDKLKTYKHTFKKSGDKYYWYSSEIYNNTEKDAEPEQEETTTTKTTTTEKIKNPKTGVEDYLFVLPIVILGIGVLPYLFKKNLFRSI